MSDLIIRPNNLPLAYSSNPIVFISDLHFDFTNKKFNEEAAAQMEDDFVYFVKEHYSNNILCLAGDFYNNYKKTLSFIKRLEKNKIIGFFVLGNHDYWNDGTLSHLDIINLFSTETQDYQYFKFLTTGRKYYYENICVIGDTGWTSFRRGNDKKRVQLQQFMDFPDAKLISDFKPEKIIDLHDEWVSFANDVLNKELQVLIVTHFPMIDFTKNDKDCWWSSATQLTGNNSWQIFGHTHQEKGQINNNVSSQRGYSNYYFKFLKRGVSAKTYRTKYNKNYAYNSEEVDIYAEKSRENATHDNQYTEGDFGKLEKIPNFNKSITTYELESIATFYTPIIVQNENTDLTLVSSIKRRGYRRCAANKHNFAALVNHPKNYLKRVKKEISQRLPNTYIGYMFSDGIPNRVIESIYHAIAIIESGNVTDIRAFMTAAVITGYVYNRMPCAIENMRPLDDYDIIRFWMMFLTIKQFKIGVSSIGSILSEKKKTIIFNNAEIHLPSINDISLDIDTVKIAMHKTTLLSPPSLVLPESQNTIYVRK